jgi:hypothetical protein
MLCRGFDRPQNRFACGVGIESSRCQNYPRQASSVDVPCKQGRALRGCRIYLSHCPHQGLNNSVGFLDMIYGAISLHIADCYSYVVRPRVSIMMRSLRSSLWSSGQSSWLPDFLSSNGSETGSTQPHEDK